MSQHPNEFLVPEILYEDETCFVIAKPAGIAMHPGNGMKEGEKTMLDALKPLFIERSLPFSDSAVLIHRLDKDTTGVLLVAKSQEDHLFYQTQFSDRTISKQYLAIVFGAPNPPAAIIDAPIGRHGTARTRMSVHHAVHGRSAKTIYHTLASTPQASLLLLDLYTGRTHQIRVHLSTIGHPVLGDVTYATPGSAALNTSLSLSKICLHAWKIQFESRTHGTQNILCPPPLYFQESCHAFDFAVPQK
jgi:23S rRNA pseudouridine1911/1915/1917 synthase